jgi:hypothetical protein
LRIAKICIIRKQIKHKCKIRSRFKVGKLNIEKNLQKKLFLCLFFIDIKYEFVIISAVLEQNKRKQYKNNEIKLTQTEVILNGGLLKSKFNRLLY